MASSSRRSLTSGWTQPSGSGTVSCAAIPGCSDIDLSGLARFTGSAPASLRHELRASQAPKTGASGPRLTTRPFLSIATPSRTASLRARSGVALDLIVIAKGLGAIRHATTDRAARHYYRKPAAHVRCQIGFSRRVSSLTKQIFRRPKTAIHGPYHGRRNKGHECKI